MKKSSLVMIPIVLVALFALFGGRLITSGAISPTTMLVIALSAFVLMMLIRPKKQPGAQNADAALALLGDHAKRAFQDDEALSNQFASAISDCLNGMPKSATGKLEKLQPLCKTDSDTYAVCVALGMTKANTGDFDAAIKLYNKAVVLFPSTQLAATIGSCQQRIGELEEAMDSYAFALELDPDNIAVRSQLATAYVADGDFEMAIEHAQLVLDREEQNASALATIAICHGVLGHETLYKGYTAKAVDAGYKEDKITSTVPALQKKYKKTLEALK